MNEHLGGFMKMRKSIGPKTLPCGTQLVTVTSLDGEPLTTTRFFLSVRNSAIHL